MNPTSSAWIYPYCVPGVAEHLHADRKGFVHEGGYSRPHSRTLEATFPCRQWAVIDVVGCHWLLVGVTVPFVLSMGSRGR